SDYVCSVWMGFGKEGIDKGKTTSGYKAYPGKVVQSILKHLKKDGSKKKYLSQPDSVVQEGDEYYKKGTEHKHNYETTEPAETQETEETQQNQQSQQNQQTQKPTDSEDNDDLEDDENQETEKPDDNENNNQSGGNNNQSGGNNTSGGNQTTPTVPENQN
ncbi:hypothetical protein H5999_11950, partial [[Clostridium] spiroforme]|nr:hypothetical protein [Thomasclavelia spiroformis]